MMDRDSITRTGARAPGVEQHKLLLMAVLKRTTAPTQRGRAPNRHYGSFIKTARSGGSLATFHPPPKASINCTLLVICCTRSVITAC
jgi:hypothetical protein